MKPEKKIVVVLIFLAVAVLFLGSASAGYTEINPVLTSSGISLNFGTAVDRASCSEGGIDFVIQVAPFGCTPAVVRSDLLEEQDYPVFCQLYATKLNPLINVNAINNINFVGQMPDGVRDVKFYPSRAALGSVSSGLFGGNANEVLNRPVLNNIGYAIILLKKVNNESALKNCEKSDLFGIDVGDVCWVGGNMTARLSYNIENAFGIGKVNFYLSERTDKEFVDTKNQYSFWNGRGYLRAESVSNDKATIAVYNDRGRLTTFNLNKGETSSTYYLPGFQCLAGMRVTLNGLAVPNTRAKLEVNGEVVEVSKDEPFLDDQCRARNVEKNGVIDLVTIKCDDNDPFTLRIVPKVKLKIGNETRDVGLGENLYVTDEGAVYLGYIGSNSNGGNEKDLYVTLFNIPENKPALSPEELNEIEQVAGLYNAKDVSGNRLLDSIGKGIQYLAGLSKNLKDCFLDAQCYNQIDYGKSEEFKGKIVDVLGFSGGSDAQIDGDVEKNYDLAVQDFDNIINTYAGTSYPSDAENTKGEEAMLEKIKLASRTGQNMKITEFCTEFKEAYPNSKLMGDADNYCLNKRKISSSSVTTYSVAINGKVKEITLDGVREPSYAEYGAEIYIQGPNGYSSPPIPLMNNGKFYLDAFRDYEIYGIQDTGINILLTFDKEKGWQFSESGGIGWDTVSHVDPFFKPELKNLLKSLQGVGYEEGIALLPNNYYLYQDTREYIQLTGLDTGKATIATHIRPTSFAKGVGDFIFSSNSVTLEEDVPKIISTSGGAYTFTLRNVNLVKEAKVTVVPKIDYQNSETPFSFKIGVEKRSIKLSPEKTRERINALNETIAQWTQRNDKLGKVVSGLKAACLVTGIAFTVQNFLNNLNGKAIARKDVMRGKGGWYEQCTLLASDKSNGYNDLDDCLYKNSDKINKDVDAYYDALRKQNENLNTLQKDFEKTSFLGEKTVDTDGFKKVYISESYKQQLRVNLNAKYPSGYMTINNEEIDINQFVDSLEPESATVSDFREMELLAGMSGSDSLNELSDKGLKDVVNSIHERNKGNVASSNLEKAAANDIKDPVADIYPTQNSVEGVYRGSTFQAGNRFGVAEGIPMMLAIVGNIDYYLELEAIDSNQYLIKNIYNNSGQQLADNDNTALEIKKLITPIRGFDSASYNHLYKASSDGGVPSIKYYETEPYAGLPAIVPYDLKNGWYAATKPTLSGALASFDASGRVTSFYVCNVGPNGIEDNIGKDDICRLVNTGTGEPYNKFNWLEDSEASKIIDCAVSAIRQASKLYPTSGKIPITTDCAGRVEVPVGKPAVDVPDIKCMDVYSPTQCRILFNVCDPVICPSSRCDLGGAYPVKDVIQSGVIGSIALCLPNFPEVYVPICLSGVHAGIDGWISVLQSHKDCLQESLDTGKTVGICDQIYSVYACEMFWKEGINVANLAVPRLLEVATGQNSRGGGEYLGVQSAWKAAGESADYFSQYYAKNTIDAFKARSTQDVGTQVCKVYASATFPTSADALGKLLEPDSPVQFTGNFEEIPLTTATNPPLSQYKVYYHIFAGNDQGVYYKVYLKGGEGSYYQDTNAIFNVPGASSYVKRGETVDLSPDFTAASGYKQLCIVVNNQEECGFKQVSTDFAVNYIAEKYVAQQADASDITSAKECVSGTPSLYSLLNLNVEAGIDNTLNPNVYNSGLTRICSTDCPASTEDACTSATPEWIDVGYCGDRNLRCWLSRSNVNDIIKNANLKDGLLEDQTKRTLDVFEKSGLYILGDVEFEDALDNYTKASTSKDKINELTKILDKLVYGYHKGHVYLLRGEEYGGIAMGDYLKIELEKLKEQAYPPKEAPIRDKDGNYLYKDKNGNYVSVADMKKVLDAAGISYEGMDDSEVLAQYNYVLTISGEVQGPPTPVEISNVIAKARSSGVAINSNCDQYFDMIKSATNNYGIDDPLLLVALMQIESSCNQNAFSGSSYGLMQINLNHCGEYGLPTDVDSCKQTLADPTTNINIGAQILKKGYSLESYPYKCNAFTSAHQIEPAVDKIYSGWERAVRLYNGPGCAGYRNDGTEISADQDFVEKVMGLYNKLKSGELSLQNQGANNGGIPTGEENARQSLDEAKSDLKEIVDSLNLNSEDQERMYIAAQTEYPVFEIGDHGIFGSEIWRDSIKYQYGSTFWGWSADCEGFTPVSVKETFGSSLSFGCTDKVPDNFAFMTTALNKADYYHGVSLLLDWADSTNDYLLTNRVTFSGYNNENIFTIQQVENYFEPKNSLFYLRFSNNVWKIRFDDMPKDYWEEIGNYNGGGVFYKYWKLILTLKEKKFYDGAITIFNLNVVDNLVDIKENEFIPVTNSLKCEDCGNGILNGCDRNECFAIGSKTGRDCIFIAKKTDIFPGVATTKYGNCHEALSYLDNPIVDFPKETPLNVDSNDFTNGKYVFLRSAYVSSSQLLDSEITQSYLYLCQYQRKGMIISQDILGYDLSKVECMQRRNAKLNPVDCVSANHGLIAFVNFGEGADINACLSSKQKESSYQGMCYIDSQGIDRCNICKPDSDCSVYKDKNQCNFDSCVIGCHWDNSLVECVENPTESNSDKTFLVENKNTGEQLCVSEEEFNQQDYANYLSKGSLAPDVCNVLVNAEPLSNLLIENKRTGERKCILPKDIFNFDMSFEFELKGSIAPDACKEVINSEPTDLLLIKDKITDDEKCLAPLDAQTYLEVYGYEIMGSIAPDCASYTSQADCDADICGFGCNSESNRCLQK